MTMTDHFIRVRLHFDYAPPAVGGCRMCWLLVDLRSCRVVADLEGIIRDKFELSRGSILSLFIDDCYLPHTESVLVVRDNDCVRVKVDSISETSKQMAPEASSENKRKRQRTAEEEESFQNVPSLEFKKNKRKKSVVENPAVNSLQTETEDTHRNIHKKKKDKKKQKEVEQKSTPRAPVKTSPSVKKPAKSIPKMQTRKPQSSSSSSSSSSSEDEQPAKKIPPSKPESKPAPTSTLAAPKTIPNGHPLSKKIRPPTSSSSSDTDSSTEKDVTRKLKSTNDPNESKVEESVQSTNNAIPNGAIDSEEEIELVIKRPVQHPHGRIVLGQTWQQQAGQQAFRGRGRGNQEPRASWGKGRERGNCVQYNYHEKEEQGRREASYSTDSLTNVSVVLQNGPSAADYSSMPLLAAPPQVGQKIAFKLLELTENYTPEVSDYKEAKILNFDPNTKQIELELLTSSQAPSEPGKFDLVYQNPDGSESVEYAVDRGSQRLVMERWDSLLEPRLVI